ncbi:PREDICTED: translation initiation factor IF-2-like, partial [Chinchilla lanigera]|uniref:translation initiation factor IF-2-like n=1 Tax=Chinchilla lanigera TaxID=34839 RepID=UPI000697FACB
MLFRLAVQPAGWPCFYLLRCPPHPRRTAGSRASGTRALTAQEGVRRPHACKNLRRRPSAGGRSSGPAQHGISCARAQCEARPAAALHNGRRFPRDPVSSGTRGSAPAGPGGGHRRRAPGLRTRPDRAVPPVPVRSHPRPRPRAPPHGPPRAPRPPGPVPAAPAAARGVRARPRLRAVRGGVAGGAARLQVRGAQRPAAAPGRRPAAPPAAGRGAARRPGRGAGERGA